MRTGPIPSPAAPLAKMATAYGTTIAKATLSPPPTVQRSPWHSPVPYLFGGLAAMMGLIAFALLILACSYRKLSGAGEGGRERHVEGGATDADKGDGGSDAEAPPVFKEKFLVIMAGDFTPTFLATPICNSNKTCFLNDEKVDGEAKGKEKEQYIEERRDETEQENGDEADELFQVSREYSH